MFTKLGNLLIGKKLKTEELSSEKFSVLWGLPIMSSDAISSVAYASEAILLVLVPVLGAASFKYMLLASLCIVLLLFTLVVSYRQIIDSYPSGGGSYIVAGDNLGVTEGLIAGAALLIDYILTVAVSISSGADAIISAFPNLLNYKVIICLIVIFLITLGNLRGIRDSSKMFGTPTYLFLGCMIVLIATGLVRHFIFGYAPKPVYSIQKQVGNISALLFLNAFASGCTALTGVEAVSNGIPSFQEPSQKNAKKVMLLLAVIVLFLFGGVSFLATIYKAGPQNNVTIISQIATLVFTGNFKFMYYAVQVTTAIILILAANTAYAGLPLLLSIMAQDGFVPRQFAKRGKRLSFSNGIILLWIAASLLVLAFQGNTHHLLPLYAVGVFISFSLSQVGMFLKWCRSKEGNWIHKAVINGIGAVASIFTFTIIGITRFTKGAWFVLILIPAFVFLFKSIKKHYDNVSAQLTLALDEKPKDVSSIKQKQYVIVPIETLNKSFLKALNYARTISDNIIVFHVSIDPQYTSKLVDDWKKYNIGIPMVIKYSPYRDIVEPLCRYIDSEEYVAGPNDMVTVVMPKFVTTKWWHYSLHNQTTMFVRNMLLKKRNVAFVTVPYIINE